MTTGQSRVHYQTKFAVHFRNFWAPRISPGEKNNNNSICLCLSTVVNPRFWSKAPTRQSRLTMVHRNSPKLENPTSLDKKSARNTAARLTWAVLIGQRRCSERPYCLVPFRTPSTCTWGTFLLTTWTENTHRCPDHVHCPSCDLPHYIYIHIYTQQYSINHTKICSPNSPEPSCVDNDGVVSGQFVSGKMLAIQCHAKKTYGA